MFRKTKTLAVILSVAAFSLAPLSSAGAWSYRSFGFGGYSGYGGYASGYSSFGGYGGYGHHYGHSGYGYRHYGLALSYPYYDTYRSSNYDYGRSVFVPGRSYRKSRNYRSYRRSRKPRRTYISCSRGRQLVRKRGFRSVHASDCTGSKYSFTGRKGSRYYRVRMYSRSGRIYRISRI